MVKGSSDCRPHDEADAEKGLQTGKHGGHGFRKLFGDNAKARGEKSRVADGLHCPNHEAERDEGFPVLDFVQEAKYDAACAGGEDSHVENPFGSEPAGIVFIFEIRK